LFSVKKQMKKYSLIILLSIGTLLRMNSQTYKEQFNKLVDMNDTIAQENLLKDWKKATPNDAELYTAGFNYYVRKSMKQKPGKPQGEMSYNPKILKVAYTLIDSGIARFPERLDMRFGKISVLGDTKNYNEYTKEIIFAVDYSSTIKNDWKWIDNAPVKNDKKKFFLGSIQEYINLMLETKNEGLLDNVRKIAEEVMAFYPKEAEFISDDAITFMLKEDYDNALKIFAVAEKIAPHNSIVITNMGHCYAQKGDNANAIKYYELVELYGNDEDKKMAAYQLKELKPQ